MWQLQPYRSEQRPRIEELVKVTCIKLRPYSELLFERADASAHSAHDVRFAAASVAPIRVCRWQIFSAHLKISFRNTKFWLHFHLHILCTRIHYAYLIKTDSLFLFSSNLKKLRNLSGVSNKRLVKSKKSEVPLFYFVPAFLILLYCGVSNLSSFQDLSDLRLLSRSCTGSRCTRRNLNFISVFILLYIFFIYVDSCSVGGFVLKQCKNLSLYFLKSRYKAHFLTTVHSLCFYFLFLLCNLI